MSKLIGFVLLTGAILLILFIGKTAPGGPIANRPSETTAPQANVKLNSDQSPVSAGGRGGAGTVISDSSQSEVQKAYIGSAGFFGYPKEYSRITLYSRLKEGEAVDITGWKIKSNKNEIIIPQAVEIYNPDGSAQASDIILKPGNYVELYSLTSPVNRNLRLNKCVGYLEEIYNFQPIYLSRNCPAFSGSEIRQFSGQCQSYLLSLSACKTPDVNFYNNLPGTDEGNACRAFLQTIGYGNCFRGHRQDADFLSNNWIVWLETQTLNLDSRHDYLRLYDRKGNLVSEYNY